jgi:lysozyme
VPTIGYGATYYQDGTKVKLGQTITREQANQLLKDHLKQFEGSVIGLLNKTKVNQNQFDALVSFCFNLGAGNLAKSQLLRFIKANPNDPKIAAEFLKWNRAGGEVSTGLVRRRKKEAQLYFTTIVS